MSTMSKLAKPWVRVVSQLAEGPIRVALGPSHRPSAGRARAAVVIQAGADAVTVGDVT